MNFNEKKTTQAAARFLRLAGNRMNYMKLIKLLYLMDREALIRWSRPVTGATYFSMKYGPVLSEVRDLVTDEPFPGEEGFWAKHISAPEKYEVTLLQDAGRGKLSEAEEDLIDEIYQKYGRYDPFALVQHLHEILPEWAPVTAGCAPLSYADILATDKRSPEEIATIEDELAEIDRVHTLFAAQ